MTWYTMTYMKQPDEYTSALLEVIQRINAAMLCPEDEEYDNTVAVQCGQGTYANKVLRLLREEVEDMVRKRLS